jgi:hypothetical protein
MCRQAYCRENDAMKARGPAEQTFGRVPPNATAASEIHACADAVSLGCAAVWVIILTFL